MNNTVEKASNIEKIKGHVLYVTHSRYDNDWQSIPHTHAFAEFFYVISGKGQFLVNNTSFDIKEDDLIIVNANVEHTETSKNNLPLEYIVVGIEGLDFHTYDQSYTEGYSVHNYREYKHEILFYLKTLLLEMNNPDDYSSELIQNILTILLINIIRRTKTSLNVSTAKKTTKECEYIEKYINDYFKEHITLDKLSEITYLNKYYLVHAFKRYKGISPINYLTLRRIDEAKLLLKTTDHSINTIAITVGFSGLSYFTQAFKKTVGLTPSQYRKNNANFH